MTRLHFEPLMSQPEIIKRLELAHELHEDVKRTKHGYRTAPPGLKVKREKDYRMAVARLAAERKR